MKYLIVFAIAFIQGVLFLVHFIVFKALAQLYNWQSGFLFWLFCALSLSFTITSVLTHYFDNLLTRFFYYLSSVWLGFLFYLTWAAIIYFLANFLFLAVGKEIDLISFGQGLMVIAVMVSLYGLVNANTIQTTHYSIRLNNLPEAWRNKKIVWVSDVHLGQIRGRDFAARVVEKINQENPELVLIGGDIFDGVKADLDKIISPFSGLQARLGTLFITGNHEEFGDNKLYLEAIKKIGIRVLNNEVVDLAGINFVGVDYSETMNHQKYQEILSLLNYNRNLPTILLKHVPDDLVVAADHGVNLQISGHVHLAQVWPANIITRLIYGQYEYGLHDFKQMQVLTSSGVGTWGPPLKVGSPPEIVVIKFE